MRLQKPAGARSQKALSLGSGEPRRVLGRGRTVSLGFRKTSWLLGGWGDSSQKAGLDQGRAGRGRRRVARSRVEKW